MRMSMSMSMSTTTTARGTTISCTHTRTAMNWGKTTFHETKGPQAAGVKIWLLGTEGDSEGVKGWFLGTEGDS